MTVRQKALREGPWARLTGASLLVAVMTFATVQAGLGLFLIPGAPSVSWWPVNGLVLVLMLRCPRRWWPLLLAVFFSAHTVSLLPVDSILSVASYSLIDVAEVLIAAHLIQPPHERSARGWTARQETVRFLVALAASVSAGAAMMALHVVVFGGGVPVGERTVGYVVTHVIGLLAVAPLLLRGRVWRWDSRTQFAEFALLVAITVAVSAWLFLQPHVVAQAFPVLLPVIWAAIRFDALQATIVSLLTCSMVAFGTSRAVGAFGRVSDPSVRQLLAQSLIATVVATTVALVLINRHRERLSARARDSEKTLTFAIQEALVGIFSLRLDPGHVGEIKDVNAAMCLMVGYEEPELVGRPIQMLLAANDHFAQGMLDTRIAQLAAGEIDAVQREVHLTTAAGDDLLVEISATRMTPSTAPPYAFVYVHDLTGREESKKMLEAMALTDALTGLPNRSVLFNRLDEQLFRARREDVAVGLLYLDLNGFKPVNDTFGHNAGDAVLVEVARRLERAMRPEDTVARLGGDEFAILVPRAESEADLTALAEVIHAELAAPIPLASGQDATIGTAIGIALGTATTSADELLRTADEAMYRAKEMSRAGAPAAR